MLIPAEDVDQRGGRQAPGALSAIADETRGSFSLACGHLNDTAKLRHAAAALNPERIDRGVLQSHLVGTLDWTALAKGMGVPARRVETLEDFGVALRDGFASGAPNLIEVPL